MTIPNHIAELEGMDTVQLTSLREELVSKARTVDGKMQASRLPDEDLSKLVAIFAILRRRASPGSIKKPSRMADMSQVPDDL